MECRVAELGPFTLIGFTRRVPIVFEGVNPAIAAMDALFTPEVKERLLALNDTEPRGFISASLNFSEGRMREEGGLDHWIGTASARSAPAGFDALPVAAATWAVFSACGPYPKALQDVWGRIYAEWLPSSGYEPTGGPELLRNLGTSTSDPEYRSEIWLPVRKKQG